MPIIYGCVNGIVHTTEQPIVEAVAEEQETRICSKCGRELPIELFSKNYRKPENRTRVCQTCQSNSNHLRYERRKERKSNDI